MQRAKCVRSGRRPFAEVWRISNGSLAASSRPNFISSPQRFILASDRSDITRPFCTAPSDPLDGNDAHAVVSTFDLFTIGVGPSSSHTVGPMRAARRFVAKVAERGLLSKVNQVKVELFGSLACTGEGHRTPEALLMGLEGQTPEDVEPAAIDPRVQTIKEDRLINIFGSKEIHFDYHKDMLWHRDKVLPEHSNGLRFSAYDVNVDMLHTGVYYSIGGGFVIAGKEEGLVDKGENVYVWRDSEVKEEARTPGPMPGSAPVHPVHPFRTAKDLLRICQQQNKSIAQVVLENECVWRSKEAVYEGVLNIWRVMDQCIRRGCGSREATIPGSIKIKRRAPGLYYLLHDAHKNPLLARDADNRLDWLCCYAIAVNEENAAGGRVVTAPTNGAAGIIPAVLKYYTKFVDGANRDGIVDFLLTASAVGQLIKRGASISAAEVGCQGEVGVACSMAAAGLAAAMGGTVTQVENAAEIGMEHNLGLTCDPIGGLVQIPCIERNAMGSSKAVAAARLALAGDGTHIVSLDSVIKTMRQTGLDMKTKYKETSEGGLAVNVSLPVC